MADTRFYIERRETVAAALGRGGVQREPLAVDRGVSWTHVEPDRLVHRWAVPAPGALPAALPQGWAPQAEAILEAKALPPDAAARCTELAERLAAAARRHQAERVEVLVHHTVQRVLQSAEGGGREDRRALAICELRIHPAREGATRGLWRTAAEADLAALEGRLPALEQTLADAVQALREQPTVPCPKESLTVVLPPGAAAGAFFHEVCGHPLEADVVARRASYLATRLGQRVAPEHVTVADDPTTGQPDALAYAADDEGSPARAVKLVDAGVVGDPLLDLRSAVASGRAPNGHGRRVSFRHLAIPRMGHTCVAPVQGTLQALIAPVRRGLLVQHLTPRHMNLLSGDFSFYLVEARQIVDGQLGPWVAPGLLRGNGLEALRSIEAVGSDTANMLSTRRCQKLDHGPLYVSFGHPSVRFGQLWVEPAERWE